MISIEKGHRSTLILKEKYGELQPQLSPDGDGWRIVPMKPEPSDICPPFPDVNTGGHWQISTEGGNSPRWSRDGKELYYLAGFNAAEAVMAVKVEMQPTFSHGKPITLFRGGTLFISQ